MSFTPYYKTQYPISVSELRERALVAADFNPEAVGAFLKKATEKLIQKLDATTTKFFSEKGIITDSVVVEDHTSQIAAASELISIGIDIMGLKRRGEQNRQDLVSPHVTIDLSGWSVQPPVSPNGLPHVEVHE